MLSLPTEIASMIVDEIALNNDDIHAFSSACRQAYTLGTHNQVKTGHLTLDLRDQRAIREARALRIIQAPLEIRSVIRTLTIKSSVLSLDEEERLPDREMTYVGLILALVSALPELAGLKLVNLAFDMDLGSRLSARIAQFCPKLEVVVVDGVGGDMQSIQDFQLGGLKKFSWTWSVGPPPGGLLQASADTIEELELDFHNMITDYSSEEHILSFANLTFPRLQSLKLLPVSSTSELELVDQCFKNVYSVRKTNRNWDHPACVDPTEDDAPNAVFLYDATPEDENMGDEGEGSHEEVSEDGPQYPPEWVPTHVTNFILRHPTICSLSLGEHSTLEYENDSLERAVIRNWVKESRGPVLPNLESLRASYENIYFLAKECPSAFRRLKSLTVIFDQTKGDLVELVKLVAPHMPDIETITIERPPCWLDEMIVGALVKTIGLLAGPQCPKFSQLVYIGQPEGDEENTEPADRSPLTDAGKQHRIEVLLKEMVGPVEFKADDVL